MRTVRPLRTRVAGGLAVLALGGSLAACGGSTSSEATDDPAAAPSSSATDSPSDEPTGDPTTSDSPATLDDGAEVAVDDFVARIRHGIEATTSAHMDVTMSGAGGEMNAAGDVDYAASPPDMSMTMDLGAQTLTMLVVDKVMYVKSSKQGDKYVKYDLDDPNNPLGSSFTEQLDPASSVEAFTKAVTSVRSLGREDVAGQQLDHYVMSVDPTELAAGAQAQGMPAELTVDVWLDDQDRMVKTAMDLGPVQYLAVLSKLGEKVALAPPSDDQVITPPSP